MTNTHEIATCETIDCPVCGRELPDGFDAVVPMTPEIVAAWLNGAPEEQKRDLHCYLSKEGAIACIGSAMAAMAYNEVGLDELLASMRIAYAEAKQEWEAKLQ